MLAQPFVKGKDAKTVSNHTRAGIQEFAWTLRIYTHINTVPAYRAHLYLQLSQISVKYLDNASMVFPEGVIRVCQHDAFMIASDPPVPKEEEVRIALSLHV